jgi:UDP-N-acetylmuramate dehydrogenase
MPILTLRHDVPLRGLTTLEVGGPARALATCGDPAGLRRALEIADEEGLPVALLGGGSNVLIADRGFEGMIVQYTADRLSADLGSGRVHVEAGYSWDALVEWTVAHRLAGLECLSGIPGWVGAAPIQNIGAYGQEIAPLLRWVHTVRVRDGQEITFSPDECGFAYRDSRFKRAPAEPHCVTALELELEREGTPAVTYAELAARLEQWGDRVDATAVRAAVLEIRRAKSMVLDERDPNRRSAGSFFTNPVVDASVLEAIATALGSGTLPPHWPLEDGRVKLAAAWLIENAGFARGEIRGNAGLSSAHALALINRGGATAAELLAFAHEIRARVQDRFGVRLCPEPVPLGFSAEELDEIW